MTPVEAVSFDASAQGCTALEDVLTLINEKSDAHDRLIVVFDEFQEIANLDPGTDKLLRAASCSCTKVSTTCSWEAKKA